MNNFEFFPVGHGLFYFGSIDSKNFNFVYDCGTESSVNISNYIDLLHDYLDDRDLDFVVLSHLHIDHFSGLQHLLKTIHVKKLYLPYLGNTWILKTTLLTMSIIYSINSIDNIDLILRYLNIAKSIYEREEASFIIDDNSSKSSFSVASFDEHEWIFKFFSKSYPLAKINLLGIKINAYLKTNSFVGVEDAIKNGKIQDIKLIYESIFGKNNQLNKTSICLLHYPKKGSRIIFRRGVVGLKTYYHPGEGVTFLTGDAMITKKELLEMNIDKTIDVFQVPHHGSKSNWKNVSSLIYCDAVLSCSNLRRHRLPNKDVIKSIDFDKYNECNESSDFLYTIY